MASFAIMSNEYCCNYFTQNYTSIWFNIHRSTYANYTRYQFNMYTLSVCMPCYSKFNLKSCLAVNNVGNKALALYVDPNSYRMIEFRSISLCLKHMRFYIKTFFKQTALKKGISRRDINFGKNRELKQFKTL